MCSLQIYVLFVFMRVEIYLFNSGIVESYGVFLLVMFLCAILLRMGYGRSLSVLRILSTGMCCLLAWYSMLVNVLFASCMSVGGCIAVNASSVSCVNLPQSAFLYLVYDRLLCCIVCLLSVCIVMSIGRWSEFSAWIVVHVVLLYSKDEMVVMPGDVG